MKVKGNLIAQMNFNKFSKNCFQWCVQFFKICLYIPKGKILNSKVCQGFRIHRKYLVQRGFRHTELFDPCWFR